MQNQLEKEQHIQIMSHPWPSPGIQTQQSLPSTARQGGQGGLNLTVVSMGLPRRRVYTERSECAPRPVEFAKAKRPRAVFNKASNDWIASYAKVSGFTLIEILIVISIIGLLFSVSLPVSYSMYRSYTASLKAEEVMVFISTLKRESFLYSEAKELSSKNGVITVNGKEEPFDNTIIQIDQPIKFYKNGTTSGGTLKIYVFEDQVYSLNIQAPFGNLILERRAT